MKPPGTTVGPPTAPVDDEADVDDGGGAAQGPLLRISGRGRGLRDPDVDTFVTFPAPLPPLLLLGAWLS